MIITSKWDGSCTACGGIVNVGERVFYERGEKGVQHMDCDADPREEEWGDVDDPYYIPDVVERIYQLGQYTLSR